MDPLAALTAMRDEGLSLRTRLDAAEALAGWLANGGYVPHGLFANGGGWGGHQAAQAAARRIVDAEWEAIADEYEARGNAADWMQEQAAGNLHGRNVL